MTVSDSLIENCNTETRIDHHVDDIDDRASQNSYHTIDGLNSSSSGDGYSSEATKSTKRGLGRPLMIVVAILKSRHLRGPITTESHPLNLATTGRDNSLGTIVTTMESSVTARLIKIDKIIRIIVTRIKIETSFVITLITTIDNTTIMVFLTPTLIFNSVRDITPAEIKTMRDSILIPHTEPTRN